ncbi:hypothetical protein D9M69_638830 [compost metagenome]
MWFQMTSNPSCGIGKGLDPVKFSRPLPPSTSLVLTAFLRVASSIEAGMLALRWDGYTFIR